MSQVPSPTHADQPPGWFRDAEGENARTIILDDGIRELCHAIVAQGLLQPVGAIDHGSYGIPIFGFRRLAAIRFGISEGLAVPEKIPTLLFPPSTTRSQIQVINLTENMQRLDLSDPEIYRSLHELMALNPGWDRKALATHLSKDPSTITRWLSPDDLAESAKQAFLDGKFGFSKAYAIAKLPKEQQPPLLDLTLGGATRDDLERRVRKERVAGKPAVRASKTKISLGSGVTVIVTGAEVSLDEAIDALAEAIKEAKKAREQSLDIKTFAAVMHDRAKAC